MVGILVSIAGGRGWNYRGLAFQIGKQVCHVLDLYARVEFDATAVKAQPLKSLQVGSNVKNENRNKTNST
jgi:hypothetical protein